MELHSDSEGTLANPTRIALANIRFPTTPEDSIALAAQAINRASMEGARIIGFPECFVPGYRGPGKPIPPPDCDFLKRAWSAIAKAAARANITVVLRTERLVAGGLVATALVIDPDGAMTGSASAVIATAAEGG